MTTAAAAMKTVGYGFTGKKETVQVTYDFANDGGATGVIQLAKAADDLIVTSAHAVVKTACTSGGSATVKIGVTGADSALFGTTTGAVANLTASKYLPQDVVEGTPNTFGFPRKIAAGDYVLLTIGTAALTAGKIVVTLEVMKV